MNYADRMWPFAFRLLPEHSSPREKSMDGVLIMAAASELAQRLKLPRYQCHKKVRAFKIGAIEHGRDSSTLIPEDSALPSAVVDIGWVDKHEPEAGGYFVLYDDGYQSYSPAEAFESGYSIAGAVTDEQRLEWLRLNMESQEFGEVVSMTQPKDVAAFRQVIDDLMASS